MSKYIESVAILRLSGGMDSNHRILPSSLKGAVSNCSYTPEIEPELTQDFRLSNDCL